MVDEDGHPLVWSYDRARLTLKDADTDTDWDPDCGDLYFTGNFELKIPIAPGATVANIGGTMAITITTQYCGDLSGTLQITGNLIKR